MSETAARRTPTVVPRGRHAPPLEVRLGVQRRRLFEAAATVFARRGYAEATAEAISREAGMSKATFYEHFANKEECILALFDMAAGLLQERLASAGAEPSATYEEHLRRGARAFLDALGEWPDAAQTLLVEIIGAGPKAVERRDAILEAFADILMADSAHVAPRFGASGYATRDDAFACVGAIVELSSRQLRTGKPAQLHELEPVIARVILGIVSQGA